MILPLVPFLRLFLSLSRLCVNELTVVLNAKKVRSFFLFVGREPNHECVCTCNPNASARAQDTQRGDHEATMKSLIIKFIDQERVKLVQFGLLCVVGNRVCFVLVIRLLYTVSTLAL